MARHHAPPLLSFVCNYVKRRPKDAFVFPDKKAIIIYYVPWHSVVYLLGDFDIDDEAAFLQEVHRVAASKLN